MKSRNLRTRQNVYGYILVGFSFLMLTFLTVKTFAPETNTDAESQKAEQTIGPYEMSMANDSVATVNITPTEEQSVYSVANDLTVKNTCDAGATITMTMTSSSSNSLIRTGSDSGTKEIAATTTTDLDNYSWGYALENSSTYYAVPKLGESVATIYDETKAQTDELPVYVKFGVKTDNSLPSGTYTNDVIYTMTPKPGCLTYDVTWDYDGGTAKSGATYPTSLGWGDTVDLSQLTPTREGYTFAGWTNGSSDFADSDTAADLNLSNAKSVKVKAKWTAQCVSGVTCETVDLAVNESKDYDYSGTAKGAVLSKAGFYKLEVWGASGEEKDHTVDHTHTRGGYTYGTIKLSQQEVLYINVGGANSSYYVGGWNGGGNGDGADTPAGGGGTDIRISSNSLYSRVIVAGGGGGCRYGGNGNDSCHIANLSYGNSNNAGDNGRNATLYSPGLAYSIPSKGILILAYFGLGGSAPNDGIDSGGGGGGGWYGGGSDDAGCGGGSGWTYTKSNYNTWLSKNSADATQYLLSDKYYLSNEAIIRGNTSFKDPNGTSTVGHNGNGYARITYLGASI